MTHVGSGGSPMHGRARTPPRHGGSHGTLPLSHHVLLAEHLLLLLPLYGCKRGGGPDGVEGAGGLGSHWRGHARGLWCCADWRRHAESIHSACRYMHTYIVTALEWIESCLLTWFVVDVQTFNASGPNVHSQQPTWSVGIGWGSRRILPLLQLTSKCRVLHWVIPIQALQA